MHGFKNLFLSSIPASLLALYLIPLGVCSSNENHLIIPHKFINQDIDQHKMNHRLVFEIKLHGILLWASMGFLMPLGVIIIRMFNKEECSPRKLKAIIYIHAILQVPSFIILQIIQTLATSKATLMIKTLAVFLGFIMSFILFNLLLACAAAILSIMSFENKFNNTHQRIGLALYAAILVQVLVGFRRPKRGTKGRTVWYVFHWIFGTTISLVGILNTYTGLKAYHKRTSLNARFWSILFTVEVAFMAFFYLFQEKWDYMQKQGEITVDEPVMVISSDQVENQKEVLSRQSSRKSNSLGSYFANNNALKKLFQVT